MSKKPNKIYSIMLCIPCMAFTGYSSHAAEIVRAHIQALGNNHQVDISLFDIEITETVNNFVSYIEDGSYDNLLVYRNVPSFVIQTGGYTFDPSLGSLSYDAASDTYNGGLQPVPSKGTVNNQFKHSNIRGTLAMAKIDGLPDSASNEWFFNLTDNSFLDTSNDGFTVFGKVLGNGMDTIDLLSTTAVYDLSNELNPAFKSTPLTDFSSSKLFTEITIDNLIVFNTFEKLFQVTDIVDFTDTVIGTTDVQNIIIQNNNNTEMQIGTIDTSSIAAPFSILSNPCQNTVLKTNEQCIIKTGFSPASTGFYVSELSIDIPSYGYTFPVVLRNPAPDILLSADDTSIDFGVVPVVDPVTGFGEQEVIFVNNIGTRDLGIISATFNTPNPSEFEFFDNCTENSAYDPGVVPPGKLCLLIVNFNPQDLKEKTATITIISDDPDTKQIIVPIKGGASTDTDGIDDFVEDAAPNAGDGNNDGIPDSIQNNVVSLTHDNSTYSTLLANDSISFSNVATVQESTLDILPENAKLDMGIYTFELSNIPVGSKAEFGLLLPVGNTPSEIYSYGPTQDNNNPHWYALPTDASPGSISFGDVTLTAPSGNEIISNATTISVVDGGIGDSDMTANGIISFVGGASIKSSSGSGSMLWLIFVIPLLPVLLRTSPSFTKLDKR